MRHLHLVYSQKIVLSIYTLSCTILHTFSIMYCIHTHTYYSVVLTFLKKKNKQLLLCLRIWNVIKIKC